MKIYTNNYADVKLNFQSAKASNRCAEEEG